MGLSAVSGACVLMGLLLFMSSRVYADPDMLQDICVADLSSHVTMNGYACKNSTPTADDFYSGVLASPGTTNNYTKSNVTGANVKVIPGLNTLGVSLARIDYAPGGANPPHTHPRATEVIYVLEGNLYVAFITTANVLIGKNIGKGDVFVFPKGLVHFQLNNGSIPAAVISAFNSQFPGTQSIAATLFSASSEVSDDVLTQAFRIGTKEVEKIKAKFNTKN